MANLLHDMMATLDRLAVNESDKAIVQGYKNILHSPEKPIVTLINDMAKAEKVKAKLAYDKNYRLLERRIGRKLSTGK